MKLCLIYNYAQHYRTDIFKLLDRSLDIDFVFGDQYLNIKKMDYALLNNKVKEVRNKWFGNIGWQTGVVQLAFKKYDAYIILGEPMVISTWLLLVMARLQRKRVYFWTHGWYGKETKIKALIKKTFFGLANGNFLYGNYARDLMIKEGMNPNKLHVIYNSLAYDEQLLIRARQKETDVYESHFANVNPVILFIGRLTKQKKLDMILKAQYACRSNGFCFNVVFIGDGPENVDLKHLANSLNIISDVWFYGPSYNETELSSLVYNADLCVAPGNIGLTAMHAMVYGCPCVSHNNFSRQMPEFEAIKKGVTGSFFKYDNIEDLAECIKNWFCMHNNDRDAIRQNCYKEIDEHWNPYVQWNVMKDVICYD